MATSITGASIPLDSIEVLQRDLLLQVQTYRSDANASQTSTQSRHARSDDGLRSSQIDETQNASKDELQAAHRAIMSQTESASALAPAQTHDRHGLESKASSYDGLLGGDTQPMDTQVYHAFRKPAIATTTPVRPIALVESTTGGKSIDHGTDLGGFGVQQEEESHIDLVNSWLEVASPSGQTAVSDTDELLASPQTQVKDLVRRVAFPATPQLAGHKRMNNGEILQSVARSEETPGDIFGPLKTPTISATQLFEQTQAISSPLPEGLRSDAVLIRPSPKFQENSVLTSHPGFSSSPTLIRQNDAPAIDDDLRSRYVSMRESQDKRSRSRSRLANVPEEDEDDAMLDDFEAHAQQVRLRRILSDQALENCRDIRAPGRISSSGVVKRRAGPANRHPDGIMSSPYDANDLAAAGTTNNDPIMVEDDASPSSDEEEPADEYDELNQTVRQSQLIDNVNQLATPTDEGAFVTGQEDDAEFIPGSLPLQTMRNKIYHQSQSTSIRGSQIVPQSEKRSLMQPTTQPPASSDNMFVPGSQYACRSQDNVIQRAAEPVLRRLPSSPPLPTTEHEQLDNADRHATVDEMLDDKSTVSAVNPTYNTADTHPSPAKRQSNMLASASQVSLATPLKAAGALRFADVHGKPDLHRDDSMDIDNIVEGILTEDDQQYLDAMSSPATAPARKKRRLGHTILSSEADGDGHDIADTNATEVDPQAVGVPGRETAQPNTPPSIRRRELAGSALVDQLIAARSRQQLSPSKLSGLGKRTYSRASRAKGSLLVTHGAAPPETAGPSEGIEGLRADEFNIDRSEGPVVGQVADKSHTHLASDVPTPFLPRSTTIAPRDESSDYVRPERVFALFKDGNNKFYPGSYSSRESSVVFDDGTACAVKPDEMVPLDLRIGDAIKVDLPHMRVDWMINAFENSTSAKPSQNTKVDIYGHSSLRVVPKNTRLQNIPVAKNDDGTYSINVSSVYLSRSNLGPYRVRDFPPVIAEEPRDANGTPAPPGTSLVSTPKSRSARKAARQMFYGSSPHPTSVAISVSSPPSLHGHEGVFTKMAFAITLQETSDSLRKQLLHSIIDNGGMVLDNSFDDLFIQSSLTHDHARQYKLKPKYESLRMVALIADEPSRKVKYMQALAFGLPTLHPRYISDSVRKHGRGGKDGKPPDWRYYMLAAGQSAYLDGAVRSRSHQVFLTSELMLKDMIAQRDLHFRNSNVLVVLSRDGQKSDAWQKRRQYVSLISALGADRVQTTPDLEQAAVTLTDKTWQWVYVEDDVTLALSSIVQGRFISKKRKRSEGGIVKQQHGSLCARSDDGSFTVIGDEFIVQCLIFGSLIE